MHWRFFCDCLYFQLGEMKLNYSEEILPVRKKKVEIPKNQMLLKMLKKKKACQVFET